MPTLSQVLYIAVLSSILLILSATIVPSSAEPSHLMANPSQFIGGDIAPLSLEAMQQFQPAQSDSIPAPSEVPPPNQVLFERYFKQLEGHGLFLGSAALYKDGVLYTASTGFLDAEQTIPTNAETQYRFGSITKTVVAVLTMKAVEEKLLTLDSKLSKWFPADKYKIKHADKITIELLLNHRSMVMAYTDVPEFGFEHYLTLQDVIDIIIKYQDERPEPDTVPGEYCNTGSYLLGKILERVYGSPLQELIKSKMFKPFGMTRSDLMPAFRATGSGPQSSLNQAQSFIAIPGAAWKVTEPLEYGNWASTAGAGALVSTPSDMVKFYLEVFVKKTFISLDSITQMRNCKPIVGGVNYGFGIYEMDVLVVGKEGGDAVHHPGFGHNGSVDSFQSQLSILAQNLKKATEGPDLDPLQSPYIIYTQSSNAANLDLEMPIRAMNLYGVTGELRIPRFARQEAKFVNFIGKYVSTDGEYVGHVTAVDTKITNWNEEKGDWEKIEGKQLVVKFEHIADPFPLVDMSSAKNPNLFFYGPYLLSAKFSEDGKTLDVAVGVTGDEWSFQKEEQP